MRDLIHENTEAEIVVMRLRQEGVRCKLVRATETSKARIELSVIQAGKVGRKLSLWHEHLRWTRR